MSQASPAAPGDPAKPARWRGWARRILMYIGLGVVVLFVTVFSLVSLFTQGVTSAGDDFVAAMASQQPTAAWQAAAPELQQVITEQDFATTAAANGFQGATASWNNRSRTNDDGRLRGTLTRHDGSTTPIRLDLHKNASGVWQVINLFTGRSASVGLDRAD